MGTRRLFLYISAVILVVVIAVWLVVRQSETITSHPKIGTAIGEVVPDLSLQLIDGGELTTNELRGRVIVINTFASWCGPCRVETPELVKFHQAYGENVMLIGLNVGEHKAAILGYQRDFNVSYPLVVDADGKIAELFQPRGLPTTWFIDPNGIVQLIHLGPLTAEMIAQITAQYQ